MDEPIPGAGLALEDCSLVDFAAAVIGPPDRGGRPEIQGIRGYAFRRNPLSAECRRQELNLHPPLGGLGPEARQSAMTWSWQHIAVTFETSVL